MKIILADDHTLIRENLVEFLQRLDSDVSVLEAGSFDEAKTLASRTPGLDLIILDLMMPGMNGLDGLEAMLKQFPNVPVVILSGSTQRDDILGAMKLGAKGFIPKTISGKAMINAVRLVLSGDTYIPAGALAASAADIAAGEDRESGTSDDDPRNSLTKREQEVLNLLIKGHPNKQIARQLNLKEITVKVHLQHIYQKLEVSSRTQAVAKVMAP